MTRRRIAWIALVAFVLLVAGVGLAAAAPRGGPGYVSVPGPAFQPKFPSTAFEYFGMQVRTTSGTGYYVAPVSLPHGATLNEVTILGYDSSPAQSFEVIFYRAHGGRGFLEEICRAKSAYWGGDFEVNVAPEAQRALVDNDTYGYFITLELPAPATTQQGLALTRVRFGYSYPSNVPLLSRNAP